MISKIFTKKNLEILNLLRKESLHIRDIANRLKCSPAKVHDGIRLFKKHDLVKEVEEKNRKIIKCLVLGSLRECCLDDIFMLA